MSPITQRSAVDERRDTLMEDARVYLREWSKRYRVHADLAKLDIDGGKAEYHLANFAARVLEAIRNE